MLLNDWANVCDAYGLGLPDGQPQSVPGGLQHRLYRARSARGEYAVKVLNPRLLREPVWFARFIRSEQIAQAAAQAGLPAVLALPGPNGPVQTVGPASLMVFPWQEGTTLPPTAASPDAARQIGTLLGRLHVLNPAVEGLEPPNPPHFSETHWTNLVRQGEAEQVAWAEEASASLPELLRWSEAARQARQSLGRGWVATHGDMDQKNILWSDLQTPLLLDWESAGAMNPALEVMGTALNWAGQAAEAPVAATFLAFLDGYQGVAPLDRASLRHAAAAVLDKWLVWLDLNLRRSLRAAGTPPDEQATACGAVRHSLATLRALAADTPRRLQWCEDGSRGPR